MKNELSKTASCPCGGTAFPYAKDGRFYTHPDIGWCYINVPKDFQIHRCTMCHNDILTPETLSALHEVLRASYLEHQHLIDPVVNAAKAGAKPPGAVA